MGQTGSRLGLAVMAAALAGALTLALPASAFAQNSPFTVSDPQITGPTGLTVDTTRNLYWTTNQSGGTLFGLDATGATKRQVTWGAKPVDVQALGFYDGRVYVGDIGDPQTNRPYVTVYRPNRFNDGQSPGFRAWDFAYPDGPRDAAAMAVSPKGNIYLITRGQQPGIYLAPASASVTTVNKLNRVADAPASVTDATFLADGARIAMRTDTALLIVDAFTFQTVASAALPGPGRGEAMALSLDSKDLLVAGAAAGAAVTPVPIPTRLAASTSPTPSATSAQQESVTPTATPSATVRPTGEPNNRGTLWAVIAGVALAVGAGAIAAIKR